MSIRNLAQPQIPTLPPTIQPIILRQRHHKPKPRLYLPHLLRDKLFPHQQRSTLRGHYIRILVINDTIEVILDGAISAVDLICAPAVGLARTVDGEGCPVVAGDYVCDEDLWGGEMGYHCWVGGIGALVYMAKAELAKGVEPERPGSALGVSHETVTLATGDLPNKCPILYKTRFLNPIIGSLKFPQL